MRNSTGKSAIINASVGVVAGMLLLETSGIGDAAVFTLERFVHTMEMRPFDFTAFWLFFAALFAIMNPLVAIPFFVSISQGRTDNERARLAIVVTVTVAITLGGAALFGREILAAFAISVPSFRIAGGIIVLLMGLSLLNAGSKPASTLRSKGAASRNSDAICPLGIPLLAGPGAVATIIIQCESAEGMNDLVTIAAVLIAMVLVTFFVLRVAVPIARILGQAGLTALTRLLGMIVAAIAIDMMVIGIRAIFPGMAT